MEPSARPPGPKSAALMAGILLLAVALGLAYNSVSPLGVRFGRATAAPEAQAPPAQHTPTAAPGPPPSPTPSAGETGTVRVVKWADLKPRLNSGLLLIDARPAASYQLHHIPGAISIPPETSEEDFLRVIAPYPSTQPIVVYCASITCHVSRALAKHLVQLGYTRVENLEGGMAEYLQAQQESIK